MLNVFIGFEQCNKYLMSMLFKSIQAQWSAEKGLSKWKRRNCRIYCWRTARILVYIIKTNISYTQAVLCSGDGCSWLPHTLGNCSTIFCSPQTALTPGIMPVKKTICLDQLPDVCSEAFTRTWGSATIPENWFSSSWKFCRGSAKMAPLETPIWNIP